MLDVVPRINLITNQPIDGAVMKSRTTLHSEEIKQGLDILGDLKERITMQSVTNNQSGNILAVATMVGNIKMFVGAARGNYYPDQRQPGGGSVRAAGIRSVRRVQEHHGRYLERYQQRGPVVPFGIQYRNHQRVLEHLPGDG